jgi:hypothetical protein
MWPGRLRGVDLLVPGTAVRPAWWPSEVPLPREDLSLSPLCLAALSWDDVNLALSKWKEGPLPLSERRARVSVLGSVFLSFCHGIRFANCCDMDTAASASFLPTYISCKPPAGSSVRRELLGFLVPPLCLVVRCLQSDSGSVPYSCRRIRGSSILSPVRCTGSWRGVIFVCEGSVHPLPWPCHLCSGTQRSPVWLAISFVV